MSREVALKRLNAGKEDIICVFCERRVPLWDDLEELFASDGVRERARELKRRSDVDVAFRRRSDRGRRSRLFQRSRGFGAL
jgi:hypothetical protein